MLTHWQTEVFASPVDLTKRSLAPPQLEHWPATLVELSFRHVALQTPEVVVPPSFKP